MNKINRQNDNYKPFSFHAIKVNVTVKKFQINQAICTLKKKSVKQSMFKGLIKMQRIINPIHPFMKFVINPLFNRKKYGKKAFLKIIN